jgi:fibronectin-binding autotransporter adhesin
VDGGGSPISISNIVFDTASVAAYTFTSSTVGNRFFTPAGTGTITVNGTVATSQNFNVRLTMNGNLTLTNNSSTAGALLHFNGSSFDQGGSGNRTVTLAGTHTGANSIASPIVDDTRIVSLIKNDSGAWVLSGANTYHGTTTINAGTLSLGTSAALSGSSAMILSGGTLALGNGTAPTTTGTLGVTTASALNFGSPSLTTSLKFANSSGTAWAGPLTVNGWNGSATGGGTSQLFFGTNTTGLTVSQLASINFTGFLPGARILSTGELVPAPEPAATLLVVTVAAGLATGRRRWAQRPTA